MCDTVFLTREGKRCFGKNSDRSPNEAHLMLRSPAKDYAPGTLLHTTYLEIPEASHTYATVLFRPQGIWGAEMGFNEFGLNIGNEAVFTNVRRERKNGLIGMDLLRLALERTRNATEAAELIIDLIGQYGQDGNCGYDKTFYYHNAFLIADSQKTFVLETAGRNWVLQTAGDQTTISNCLSVRSDYDASSEGFSGDFKKRFENRLFTKVAGAERRRNLTAQTLSVESDPLTAVRESLRSHKNPNVTVRRSATDSPCMHAGNLFGDHTTGSYCGEINRMYFVTGASFPCMAVFKPISRAATVLPLDETTARRYWLKRELLHRHAMCDIGLEAEYRTEGSKLEAFYWDKSQSTTDDKALDALSTQAFAAEERLVNDLLRSAHKTSLRFGGNLYFRHYWKKKTRRLFDNYNDDIAAVLQSL